MRHEKFKRHLYWGITAISVIAISIFIAFIINRFEVIFKGFQSISSILMPIIYGAGLAFLMAPVYDTISAWTIQKLPKFISAEKTRMKISRAFASFICLVILLALVALLIWLLIPQIITSVRDVIGRMPEEMERMDPIIRRWIENNPALGTVLMEQYDKTTDMISNWFSHSFAPNINKYILGFYEQFKTAIGALFDIIIGLMVMLYLLSMKTVLAGQSKKICYSLIPVEKANALIEEIRYVKWVFSNFIVGKIIDSAIIGVINYIGMSVFRMPYALLISVVVGVTNVIPFFGPFIGAIPSALILLLVSPMHCLYFCIWILVLQQLDGNVIGPRILGQTTGLPSFWVLFSILLFGGLFGIVGMIIGVPTWAVIYRAVSRRTSKALEKKKLSPESADYMDLDHIDENTLSYIKLKDAE